MKFVRGVVLVGIMAMYLMTESVVDSGDCPYKVVNYVALGDSIAKGYGLKDVESQSYVGQVAQALEDKYGAVKVTNFGKNGLRSEQLLEILEDEDNELHDSYVKQIRKADIITLSIGSNDLLQFVSTDTDFGEIQKRGDEIFTSACLRFQDNIPRIIEVLQHEAPNAQLFVNNVYNPCSDISFQFPGQEKIDLEELAETYIDKINAGFYQAEVQEVFANSNASRAQEQYVLVDVKQAFEESEFQLINMAFRWGDVDPHPNVAGHTKIAELIIPRIAIKK